MQRTDLVMYTTTQIRDILGDLSKEAIEGYIKERRKEKVRLAVKRSRQRKMAIKELEKQRDMLLQIKRNLEAEIFRFTPPHLLDVSE